MGRIHKGLRSTPSAQGGFCAPGMESALGVQAATGTGSHWGADTRERPPACCSNWGPGALRLGASLAVAQAWTLLRLGVVWPKPWAPPGPGVPCGARPSLQVTGVNRAHGPGWGLSDTGLVPGLQLPLCLRRFPRGQTPRPPHPGYRELWEASSDALPVGSWTHGGEPPGGLRSAGSEEDSVAPSLGMAVPCRGAESPGSREGTPTHASAGPVSLPCD